MNQQLSNQFTSAIDMLANSIDACPDHLWDEPLLTTNDDIAKYSKFWYFAYHALFFLDFYLADAPDTFAPPSPFTLSELERGGYPERVWTKAELLAYAQYGREKCVALCAESDLAAPIMLTWFDFTYGEMLLYNMRHVQEHAAQLSLFLGMREDLEAKWER